MRKWCKGIKTLSGAFRVYSCETCGRKFWSRPTSPRTKHYCRKHYSGVGVAPYREYTEQDERNRLERLARQGVKVFNVNVPLTV